MRLGPLLSLPLAATLALAPAFAGTRADAVRAVRSQLAEAENARETGRIDAAQAGYEKAAAAAALLGEPNLLLARALDGAADLARTGGRLEEAERGYLRAAALWNELLGPRQPRLATTLHNLGAVYLQLGRPDDAGRSFREALAIWESSFGVDSPEAANTRAALDALRSALEDD